MTKKEDVIDRVAAKLCEAYSREVPREWPRVCEFRRNLWRKQARDLIRDCSDVGDGVGLAVVRRGATKPYIEEVWA